MLCKEMSKKMKKKMKKVLQEKKRSLSLHPQSGIKASPKRMIEVL